MRVNTQQFRNNSCKQKMFLSSTGASQSGGPDIQKWNMARDNRQMRPWGRGRILRSFSRKETVRILQCLCPEMLLGWQRRPWTFGPVVVAPQMKQFIHISRRNLNKKGNIFSYFSQTSWTPIILVSLSQYGLYSYSCGETVGTWNVNICVMSR